MKLIVKGIEVDAAALLCGLYNQAKPYEPGQPQMTMQQARLLLAGNGMHCDFDRIFGRAVCMCVDLMTGALRRTDLYDAANGAGSFDAAFALAQQLELEPEHAPRVESLSDEVMDRLLSNDDA